MSIKMKKTALTILLLLCGSTSFATEEPSYNEEPKQAIGLSLGWVVANGLSYRRYFGTQFIQGTFAGAINKDDDKEYIDLSISYGNYLNKFELQNGLKTVGFKFIGGIEAERDTNRRDDLVSQDEEKSPNEFHIGVGFGLDFGNPGRRGVLYGIDLIYTASFRDFKTREFVRLGLLPSISIQYNL